MAVTQRLLSENGLNVESRQIRIGRGSGPPREHRRQGRSIRLALVIDVQDWAVNASERSTRRSVANLCCAAGLAWLSRSRNAGFRHRGLSNSVRPEPPHSAE